MNVAPIASTVMQWPPVHGGKRYWFLRDSLFKAKRFNRRLLRIGAENFDRQRIFNLLQPRASYDHRVNYWMQSAKRRGAAGLSEHMGTWGFRVCVQPAFIIMSAFWAQHELWRQEKHPFQSYMKWRRVHMEEAAREKEQLEEED